MVVDHNDDPRAESEVEEDANDPACGDPAIPDTPAADTSEEVFGSFVVSVDAIPADAWDISEASWVVLPLITVASVLSDAWIVDPVFGVVAIVFFLHRVMSFSPGLE